MKGKLLIFEGIDGSGKTTLIKKVHEFLQKKGIKCLITKEPGSPYLNLCKEIRTILLDSSINKSPLIELNLFITDRYVHYSKFIIPMLSKGYWILCDRGPLSTIAYQCYGGNVNLNLARKLNEEATFNLTPNLTLILDVDPKVAMDRISNSRSKKTWFELKGLSFFKRVKEGYLVECKRMKNCYILDANKSLQEVIDDGVKLVEKLI